MEILLQKHQISTYTPIGYSHTYDLATLNVVAERWLYSINLNDMKGVKSCIDHGFSYQEFCGLLPICCEVDVERLGGECQGQDTLLNFPCYIYSVLDSKLWVCKGLVLKSVRCILGEIITEEATSRSINCLVDSCAFAIPSGIAWQ